MPVLRAATWNPCRKVSFQALDVRQDTIMSPSWIGPIAMPATLRDRHAPVHQRQRAAADRRIGWSRCSPDLADDADGLGDFVVRGHGLHGGAARCRADLRRPCPRLGLGLAHLKLGKMYCRLYFCRLSLRVVPSASRRACGPGGDNKPRLAAVNRAEPWVRVNATLHVHGRTSSASAVGALAVVKASSGDGFVSRVLVGMALASCQLVVEVRGDMHLFFLSRLDAGPERASLSGFFRGGLHLVAYHQSRAPWR